MENLLRFKSFVSTNIIFEVPDPIDLDRTVDRIASGTAKEFPTPRHTTGVPPNAPPQVPRFLFVSPNSKLEVSTNRFAYAIQYEGNAQRSYKICDTILRKRAGMILETFVPDIVDHFAFVGLITNINLSYSGTDSINPAADLAHRFLRVEIRSDIIQDLEFRIAYRHGDSHFVNISCTNYETRQKLLKSPGGPVSIREFEMEISDTGITVIVDVNTKLYQRIYRRLPQIRRPEIDQLLDLAREVIEHKVDKLIAEASL